MCVTLQLNETTIGTRMFLQLGETTNGSISRNNRTSFQIMSAKLKCSVKCDANSIVDVTCLKGRGSSHYLRLFNASISCCQGQIN